MSDEGVNVWRDKLDPKGENIEPINPKVLIEEYKASQLSIHQKLAKARILLQNGKN